MQTRLLSLVLIKLGGETAGWGKVSSLYKTPLRVLENCAEAGERKEKGR